MAALDGIFLLAAAAIGAVVLIRLLRVAKVIIGNIVAGGAALFVAGLAGVQVPLTVLSVGAVLLTGLPGAMVVIVATIIDPGIIPALDDSLAAVLTRQ